MSQGCGHIPDSQNSICFACWMSGFRRPNDIRASQRLFVQQFQQTEANRQARKDRLEELKIQMPELATLGVTVC